MSLTYRCDPQAIELAMAKMKSDGLVSDKAKFNFSASDGLRSEVAYRDFDFLTRLSRVGEVKTGHSILTWMKAKNIISEKSDYDENRFDAFRKEVKEKFTIPGTSITPNMEQLLYMLSTLKRPQRAIGLGTYYGYALIWAIGASCGMQQAYSPKVVYAIDIDSEATEGARNNFAQLDNTDHVKFITEDGLKTVANIEGPLDYIYLDVDSREMGKEIYFELLEQLYDKLEIGGWVLAHDTCVPPFADQLAGYLAFVRDQENFSQSISFDIDPFGLELSVK